MTQAITGTRDTTYDLLSLLYHTLNGAETLAQFIQDAERCGDHELAEFFRETLEADRERASRAKLLLGARINQGKGKAVSRKDQKPRDEVDKDSMDSFPASDAPANY